jgi:hypothetical protein
LKLEKEKSTTGTKKTFKADGVAQAVKHLPSKHKSTEFKPKYHKNTHTHTKLEAGHRSHSCGHQLLHSYAWVGHPKTELPKEKQRGLPVRAHYCGHMANTKSEISMGEGLPREGAQLWKYL